MKNNLVTRSLEVSDAPALSAFLRSQTPAYIRFFHPFGFAQEVITGLLERRNKDIWMGIYWRAELIAFFMLRGWDEGYAVPVYGVLVDEKFGRCGFGQLTMKMAQSIARLRRAPRIMLKVHPENVAGRNFFERMKFKATGNEPETGNLIYHFELPERSSA